VREAGGEFGVVARAAGVVVGALLAMGVKKTLPMKSKRVKYEASKCVTHTINK
jgi:hypothetical protein